MPLLSEKGPVPKFKTCHYISISLNYFNIYGVYVSFEVKHVWPNIWLYCTILLHAWHCMHNVLHSILLIWLNTYSSLFFSFGLHWNLLFSVSSFNNTANCDSALHHIVLLIVVEALTVLQLATSIITLYRVCYREFAGLCNVHGVPRKRWCRPFSHFQATKGSSQSSLYGEAYLLN